MWRKWNINLPINQVPSDSDEDNYESPVDDDPSNLVSPRRPHQSASASPRALLRPDPPPVEEVLASVDRRLRVNPSRQERADNRNAVRAAQEAATMPATNYDRATADADDEGAFGNARDVRLPFNKDNVKLWFSLIESKMQFAGLKRQWSKRQVLVQLIPPEYHSDFKNYLQMQEAEAGNLAYYDLKNAIVKQFGTKQADNFDKAISRVMTGSPSQLGKQILNDICPQNKPLTGCHCADTVLGIWRRSLPQAVRNQIADMEFSAATYNAVFDKADSVWSANKASTSVVATLNKASSNTQDPEVAAVTTTKKNKKPKGNRGGGGGSGNGSNQKGAGGGGGASSSGTNRGPRHPDNPPPGSCGVHWKFGKAAFFCADRHNCPWRNFENPQPRHNRNISSTEIID